MLFSLDFTRERIYAVHTPMPKFPVHSETPLSKIHLSKCLTIVIRMMTFLTSLPPSAFTTFTFPEWYHIIDILVTLSRLCFPIPSIPSWDPVATRQIARYLPLVTGLHAKLEEVVKLLATSTSTSTSTSSLGLGDTGHNEKGNINIPYLFSAVLSILLEQYTERIHSFADTPFNIFDSSTPLPPPPMPMAAQHGNPSTFLVSQQQQFYDTATMPEPECQGQNSGALRDSIYPMKSGLCPVMNGALKGTGYWDAMGAFRSGVSGDAWMGSTVGGEVFDGNVVGDWGLWDL